MMNTKLVIALAAAVAFVACGGGGGGGGGGDDSTPSTPPTTTSNVPPDSAQTAEGFTAYLQSLAAQPSDTAESVDLSQFLPPKSETAEPNPVN